MPQSTLEKMYTEHAKNMNLAPLDDIRKTVVEFYSNRKKYKKISFLRLSELIEFKFVKKMLYASDFTWPTLFGLCGVLIFCFHLIKDGINSLTIGSFHTDTIFMLVLSLCLFFSAFPLLVKSFDCNIQELLPKQSYFHRLIKVTLTFLISSSLIIFAFYFLGLTKITIN